MWRHLASNALTFMIVALFVVAGVIAWGTQQYATAGPLTQGICLQVAPGSNMRRVSENLQEQGAVSSAAIFRMGADYADKSSELKAGSFLIPEAASMADIVDTVTRGGANTCGTEIVYRVGVRENEVQVRELDPTTGQYSEVTEFVPGEDEAPAAYTTVLQQGDTRLRLAVAEGTTSWQVAQALLAIDVLDGDLTDTPPEGSLAPDSYEFTAGTTRETIIARMTAAQEQILADAWAARVDGLPIETPEEALILASLIEKETAVPTERRQVASVFINRLERGMRLQTDPAVIYGVTQGQGILGRGLRRSELDTPTPWNTYTIPALPPTPIANPGKASIEAALDPDTTDYVFFVADGTGGHAFATNLDDHNRNVAAWRVIEAERAASDG
ncbi:endolytic transglycosylase MltG [Loktanella sp. SALINAS62]|uniref:endolytic transglycosylase MltG n=1 Tax=Loktanella sp. SALINAS62 TaxID=2706124 RepID=UPI001B8BCBAF|nr:endolytic transglycosylase MltG [Loktanella sp. SALINAS62]MBS1303599.1 endolytic transglycosylase MltG [Loktanella sp. SALINAS62]